MYLQEIGEMGYGAACLRSKSVSQEWGCSTCLFSYGIKDVKIN